ncbi:uncharacterized protein LOC133785192 [Humulus lupulus]|uniref:uncharacterized protein LOC133785192 n=1 Tax=Humulus lupulus TaxID=3486 RepID=UPI002B407DBA|nr:uncharacterized protein LOC133785192 [Humulus lupulus]
MRNFNEQRSDLPPGNPSGVGEQTAGPTAPRRGDISSTGIIHVRTSGGAATRGTDQPGPRAGGTRRYEPHIDIEGFDPEIDQIREVVGARCQPQAPAPNRSGPPHNYQQQLGRYRQHQEYRPRSRKDEPEVTSAYRPFYADGYDHDEATSQVRQQNNQGQRGNQPERPFVPQGQDVPNNQPPRGGGFQGVPPVPGLADSQNAGGRPQPNSIFNRMGPMGGEDLRDALNRRSKNWDSNNIAPPEPVRDSRIDEVRNTA